MRSVFIDITGQRFSRWTALYVIEPRSVPIRWFCRCDCGSEKTVNGSSLRRGLSKSCGCWRKEYGVIAGKSTVKHGMTRSPTHQCWAAMKFRCSTRRNRSHRDWESYAGRGIAICERWQTFENFLADMGERPSPAHSIDRIDVNGNYEPGNCRWATMREQSNNKRNSDWLTVGVHTLTLSEWARKTGIGRSTLRKRLDMGWPPSKAVETPIDPRKRSRGKDYKPRAPKPVRIPTMADLEKV